MCSPVQERHIPGPGVGRMEGASGLQWELELHMFTGAVLSGPSNARLMSPGSILLVTKYIRALTGKDRNPTGKAKALRGPAHNQTINRATADLQERMKAGT